MLRLLIVLALVTAAVHGRTRVVGGDDAEIKDYKYQVSLEVGGRHRCGGALIRTDMIVTAFSCIHGYPEEEEYSVRGGTSFREKGGQVQPVVGFYAMGYEPIQGDYNVLVLVVQEPFKLTEWLGIISLIPEEEVVEEGARGVVSGWGSTLFGGHFSEKLQALEVPKVSESICKQIWKWILTDRMACWGFIDSGRGYCDGDSGSPLVTYDSAGTPFLTGIVSKFHECGLGGYTGLYTDISNPDIHNFIDTLLQA